MPLTSSTFSIVGSKRIAPIVGTLCLYLLKLLYMSSSMNLKGAKPGQCPKSKLVNSLRDRDFNCGSFSRQKSCSPSAVLRCSSPHSKPQGRGKDDPAKHRTYDTAANISDDPSKVARLQIAHLVKPVGLLDQEHEFLERSAHSQSLGRRIFLKPSVFLRATPSRKQVRSPTHSSSEAGTFRMKRVQRSSSKSGPGAILTGAMLAILEIECSFSFHCRYAHIQLGVEAA